MTNEKKMTKRELFNTLLTYAEVQENEKVVEGLKHELELLDRKGSSNKAKTPTARQKENVGIKEQMVEAMEAGRKYKVSEMLKEFPFLAEFSSQRVSALVHQLCDEKKVTKVVIKRTSYFYTGELVEEEEA